MNKFKINDDVIFFKSGKVVRGQIIKIKKTWFGYRYTLMFNVKNYSGTNYLYSTTEFCKRFERNILFLELIKQENET